MQDMHVLFRSVFRTRFVRSDLAALQHWPGHLTYFAIEDHSKPVYVPEPAQKDTPEDFSYI